MSERIEKIALKQVNMFKNNFEAYCKVNQEAIKHENNLHDFAVTCALYYNKQMIDVCENKKYKELLLLIEKQIKEFYIK
jgi:hypothetical protein